MMKSAESVLQKLLADYPDLLEGDQVNPSDPRRWLLVSSEVAVSGEKGGGARWSLDHLSIVQDGIPALVDRERSYLIGSQFNHVRESARPPTLVDN